MKKKAIIGWIYLLGIILISGCGNKNMNDIGKEKSEATINEKEEIEAVDLVDVLRLCHRGLGGVYLYMDPIPEEYWQVTDQKTGSKGIYVCYDGKYYTLFQKGTVRDADGIDKREVNGNVNNEVDAFTSWIKVLREDDYLGYDAIYDNMTYDYGKEVCFSMDEFLDLYEIVPITTENVNDYFGIVTEEREEEITDSPFEKDWVYKKNEYMYIAYINNAKLSKSFTWNADLKILYDKYWKVDDYDWIQISQDYTKIVSTSYLDWSYRITDDGRTVCTSYQSDYLGPLHKFDAHFEGDEIIIGQSWNKYPKFDYTEAQGEIVIFKGIPDEYWNYTPKGNRYIVIAREDKKPICLSDTYAYAINDTMEEFDEEIEEAEQVLPDDYAGDYWNNWSYALFNSTIGITIDDLRE